MGGIYIDVTRKLYFTNISNKTPKSFACIAMDQLGFSITVL